jgi:hypothetical protein
VFFSSVRWFCAAADEVPLRNIQVCLFAVRVLLVISILAISLNDSLLSHSSCAGSLTRSLIAHSVIFTCTLDAHVILTHGAGSDGQVVNAPMSDLISMESFKLPSRTNPYSTISSSRHPRLRHDNQTGFYLFETCMCARSPDKTSP